MFSYLVLPLWDFCFCILTAQAKKTKGGAGNELSDGMGPGTYRGIRRRRQIPVLRRQRAGGPGGAGAVRLTGDATTEVPRDGPMGTSIPTPFVPSGHFPLTGGIGPYGRTLIKIRRGGYQPPARYPPGRRRADTMYSEVR